MITKEQLKDWLDTHKRKERLAELEKHIDGCIKHHALRGNKTFTISTGRVNNHARRHEKTNFYDKWHNPDLSKESIKMIQEEVVKAYKDNGFDVTVVNEDCGWNSSYEALLFKDIHKVLEDEE